MHNSLPRTIDYIEMPSKDLALTKKFFTELFGWSFQDYGPDYAAFDDGRMTGGFFALKETASVAAGAPLIVFTHPSSRKFRRRSRGLEGKSPARFLNFPAAAVSISKRRAAGNSRFGRTSKPAKRLRPGNFHFPTRSAAVVATK
jgi:catechol 2,3-dioxygenase-like lactoylglutathione lyase family enzyme